MRSSQKIQTNKQINKGVSQNSIPICDKNILQTEKKLSQP